MLKGRYYEEGNPNYNYKFIFLVEGKDDAIFLEIILEKLEVDSSEARVIICEGKSGIGKHLPLLLKSSAYHRIIECISVLRDADDDCNGALAELHAFFRKNGLPQPESGEFLMHENKKVGAYLFPKPGVNGDLEVLALELAGDSVEVATSQKFIEEMASLNVSLRKLSKRTVQAYLAGVSAEVRQTVGWAFKDETIKVSLEAVPDLTKFLKVATSPQVSEEYVSRAPMTTSQ
jgi:hypothetical protein